jgi:hypothetical protein
LIRIFPRQYFDLNIFTPYYFHANILVWRYSCQKIGLNIFQSNILNFLFPLSVCFSINVINSYFRHYQIFFSRLAFLHAILDIWIETNFS